MTKKCTDLCIHCNKTEYLIWEVAKGMAEFLV